VIDDYYIKEIRKLAGMYFVRTHGVVDAEDMVQDGILGALRAAAVCRARGYIITAARNAMLDVIRRELRHIDRVVSVDPTAATDVDVETEIDSQ
jgi:DNA-directed RNA polymerase specialized sigma24 family protein